MALQQIKKKTKQALDAAERGLTTLASLPGRYLDRVERGMKEADAARRKRDEKLIIQNFGSVEKYEQLQRDEAERLRIKNSKKKKQSSNYQTEYARRMGGTDTRY